MNSVSIKALSFGKRQTADFLLDLPPLHGLSISLIHPKDLSALVRLTELRFLYIDLGWTWGMGDHLCPVDFSALSKLEQVDVMMCRAFESLLRCRSIRELGVECDGRLHDLDLSHLSALRDLKLDHCPKLRSVELHPKARVRGLKVTLCGSYKIDWARFGPGLQFLSLGGRLTFPLEDILNAPNLRELHIFGIRKLPQLGFLKKLRELKIVNILCPPPGPNITERDWAIVHKINERRGGKSKAH